MEVQRLLCQTLGILSANEFGKFKRGLVDGGDFKPIGQALPEDATQIVTVRKMIETYGEEEAVNIAVHVLKKMGKNYTAEKLKKGYAAGGDTAARSTSAAAPPAAASMMAQQGSIIIAPNVTGCTTGTWNINITK